MSQIDFLPLSDNRVLAIVVVNSREVQNRILQMDRPYGSEELRRAANYLNQEFAGKELGAVREHLLGQLQRTRENAEQHQMRWLAYGHAGDGNLHVNFLWDDPADRPRVDACVEQLFRDTVALGGTLSGEHGIGLLKAPYLGLEQSLELIELERRTKQLFDPSGLLNPGKIFPD